MGVQKVQFLFEKCGQFVIPIAKNTYKFKSYTWLCLFYSVYNGGLYEIYYYVWWRV